MADPNKPWSQSDKKDFEKGFNEGGTNPFDAVLSAYKKVRGAVAGNDGDSCPHCGQQMQKQANNE